MRCLCHEEDGTRKDADRSEGIHPCVPFLHQISSQEIRDPFPGEIPEEENRTQLSAVMIRKRGRTGFPGGGCSFMHKAFFAADIVFSVIPGTKKGPMEGK